MNFKIDNSLGFKIAQTFHTLQRDLHKYFQEYEVTPVQWALLNRLWEQDGILAKDLADKTFKDQANTTRLLDKLQKKGFIEKKAHPTDGRAQLIFLTEKGQNLKHVLIPIAERRIEQARKGITEEEYEIFLKVLDVINQNIGEG